MIITNETNIPEPFFSAIVKQNTGARYEFDYDFSVTELLKPAFQRSLDRKQESSGGGIVEDASSLVWSFFGSIMHKVLEGTEIEGAIIEKSLRYEIEVDGKVYVIAGRPDFWKNGLLTDFKSTGVGTVTYARFDGYLEQLNIYALLLEAAGIKVDRLRNILFLKNWQGYRSKFDPKYPPSPFHLLTWTRWTEEQTVAFITERIRYHQNSHQESCTTVERWNDGDKYAVKKTGNKKATKLHLSMEDALAHAEALTKTTGKKHTVEPRPGEDKRCNDYCRVNKYCPYWIKKNGGKV